MSTPSSLRLPSLFRAWTSTAALGSSYSLGHPTARYPTIIVSIAVLIAVDSRPLDMDSADARCV